MDYIQSSTTEYSWTELPEVEISSSTLMPEIDTDNILELQAQHHSQITFEIPSHRDLEHINKMHTFNSLLQRIGNVAYDTVIPPSTLKRNYALSNNDESSNVFANDQLKTLPITNQQISKSVVLDMADLNKATKFDWEHFFNNPDMHTTLNYLWIGVVSALVILSIIFIIFSCYFYRKFRHWKKCNKDIRAHLNNDLVIGGTVISRYGIVNGASPKMDSTYCQLESPPCYTIATGLPSYDDALRHSYFKKSFPFGVQYMCPTMAAAMCNHSSSSEGHQKHTRKHTKSKEQSEKISPNHLMVRSTSLNLGSQQLQANPMLMSAQAKAVDICMENIDMLENENDYELQQEMLSDVFVA